MLFVRQGDVLLIPVDGIPAEAVRVQREGGRLILAHGEATGHAHAIASKHASLWKTAGAGGDKLYLKALRTVELLHEEHTAHKLVARVYEVRRQVEYSPEAIRRVED